MARAALLHSDSGGLLLVSLDVLGLGPSDAADLRARISAATGVPRSGILICCTHTHSGPAMKLSRKALVTVNEVWRAEAFNRIVILAGDLPHRLQSARFAHGSTRVPGIGYNRQDGSHAVDDELVAMTLESTSGEAIAAVVNYAAHAVVLGPRNLLLSADYPGAVARQLKDTRGGIGMFVQGACGDVDPAVNRDRGWGTGTFDDCDRIGSRLAGAACAALADTPRTDQVPLRSAVRTIQMPLDPPPTPDDLAALAAGFEAELAAARSNENEVAVQNAQAMLEWASAMGEAIRAGTVPSSVAAEVMVGRMGDMWVVGVPFEPYADISLRIKERLGPLRTLFAGYANGVIGYLAARWAKEQGGYGPDTSCRWGRGLLTGLGVGGDDILVEQVLDLAGEIS